MTENQNDVARYERLQPKQKKNTLWGAYDEKARKYIGGEHKTEAAVHAFILSLNAPHEPRAQEPAADPVSAAVADLVPEQPSEPFGDEEKPRKRPGAAMRKQIASDIDALPIPKQNRRKVKAPDSAALEAGAVTLEQLAEGYLGAMVTEDDASESTVSSYRNDLQVFIGYLGGPQVRTDALSPEKVAAYRDADCVLLKGNGKQKAQPTILKTRRVARLALMYARDHGLLPQPLGNAVCEAAAKALTA